jgi:hypothetical protein
MVKALSSNLITTKKKIYEAILFLIDVGKLYYSIFQIIFHVTFVNVYS